MKILAIFLCFISLSVLADQVDCFSGNERIYHGFSTDVRADGHFVILDDQRTKQLVYIYGDCVIRMDTPIKKASHKKPLFIKRSH